MLAAETNFRRQANGAGGVKPARFIWELISWEAPIGGETADLTARRAARDKWFPQNRADCFGDIHGMSLARFEPADREVRLQMWARQKWASDLHPAASNEINHRQLGGAFIATASTATLMDERHCGGIGSTPVDRERERVAICLT